MNTRTLPRTAGGAGPIAAAQSPLQQLRRVTCAALLFEDIAYESASATSRQVAQLVAQCDPTDVAKLALEVRTNQGIRKMPLFMLRELVRRPEARSIVGEYLPQVIQRADEPAEFLSMYWSEGKTPVAHQVKKGLGAAMAKFDAYQFGKYKGHGDEVSLRDVAHVTHPRPDKTLRHRLVKNDRKGWTEAEAKARLSEREFLFWQLTNDCLPVPETRETMLSGSGSDAEKRSGFISLIEERKLGASALLKSLALMEKVGVPKATIQLALSQAHPNRLLPLNFLSAAKAAPAYVPELTALMKRCMTKFTQLAGTTVIVIDTSGSMMGRVAAKSDFSRIDAACALAIMAQSVCEASRVYLTADITAEVTEPLTLSTNLMSVSTRKRLGGGGIYTTKMLKWLKSDLAAKGVTADRVVVISDSQDCDRYGPPPEPFARYNYIADISSHTHGINYDGVWTSEISGWSQSLIEYIAQLEVGYQASLF